MNKYEVNRFDAIQFISLFFVPILMAYILYEFIPIQNVNPISIVSATASINAVLWILIIGQIFINFLLVKKYSITLVVQINLLLVLLYVSSLKVLIKALSLKGTPLPGTDIRGDLLNVVNLAKLAKSDYWAGGPNPIFPDGGYPPIWPSLIGNMARILDVHVLSLFKPAELILILISPIFVLFIWRLIFNQWIALTVTINQTLIFNFDYKTITLNLLIPFLIFIIYKINEGTNLKFFTYGVFFGLVSLTYFGWIYWLIPFMIVGISLIFFSRNIEKNLALHTFLYLGIGIGLGPVIYFRLTDRMYIYYLLLFVCFLVLILLKQSEVLNKIFLILINIGLLLALLGTFVFFRTKDSWFEGGIEKNNPTVTAIINLSGADLAIFLAIFIGFLFIAINKGDIRVISILVGVYFSSTIFMYFIASQMQVTERVDLWPRAGEVQAYTLNLIFLMIFLLIIDRILNLEQFNKYLEICKQHFFYLLGFFLFLLGSFLVSSLGSQAYGSMPYHAFTGAWFAHQGCSNPHVDPMLSKVFEYNPDIQTFLRENCPSVDWPVIPKID
jgi:hypothetical protein